MQKQPIAVAAGPRPSSSNTFDNSADVERVVARIIAAKARRLARGRSFWRDDRKDLVQELTLEWLRRRRFFNPRRSSLSGYARQILDSRIASMMRERQASKRGPDGHPLSLDETVKAPEDSRASRGDLLTEDELPMLPTSAVRETQADLCLDVAAVVASLARPLRKLCSRLQTMTISEVARRTGVPRGTIYESVKKLRRHFVAAGLTDYLPTLFGLFAQER